MAMFFSDIHIQGPLFHMPIHLQVRLLSLTPRIAARPTHSFNAEYTDHRQEILTQKPLL